MADSQSLFDTLAGGFGHGVDRPGLNAFVANSQAMNGLRSAQTDEAIGNAQKQQDEANARAQLETNLANVKDDNGKPINTPSMAKLLASEMIGHFGSAEEVNRAHTVALQNRNTTTLSDPNQLNTPAQTAAAQGLSNKLAEPVAAPNTMVVPAGVTPNIQQTPQGVAATADTLSQTRLRNVQADAGGFNPNTGQGGHLTPDQSAALAKAVSEGRLDPMRVNSRSGPILAQMELNTPGMNFNGMHADAALQSNAGFQQKAISMDAMPTILSHMTSLGKKLNGGTGYSDVKSVGQMQQWMNGQLNDPEYTEYMTVRNDALMKLASVMRGVGMSDQAHSAEIQAAAPTLSPLALDGWLKGQLSTMEPLLARTQAVEHMGGDRAGNPAPKAPATAAPATSALPAYPDEAAALAAGHKAGDRVMIGGVTGTLQ